MEGKPVGSPESPEEFSGLRAVVSGGASGIGRAVVEELAARGARVVSLDITSPTDASTSARSSAGTQIHEVTCDLRLTASVQSGLGTAVDLLGGVDVVVSNAGIGSVGSVEDVDDDEWARVLDVNVVGTARLVRAALPHLRASAAAASAAGRPSPASVVCTGSLGGWTGLQRRAAYNASKGALHALVLAMAADLVGEGVRVNAVAPGTADTAWVRRLLQAADEPDAALAQLQARQPTGRLVTAEQVAHAICYLASPLAGATTGTVLQIDGGSHSLVVPAR